MRLVSNKVRLEDWEPTNIVAKIVLNHSFDMTSVSEALPIMTVSKIPKKKKIPFFGVEKVMVGIKYGNLIRGIRTSDKAPIRSFVAMDFQYKEKNVHIKLSEENMLIMGVTQLKIAKNVAKIVTAMIRMTNENLKALQSLSKKKRESLVKWLSDQMQENNNLRAIDSTELEKKIDSHEFSKQAMFLYIHASECKTFEAFNQKVSRLCELSECCKFKSDDIEVITSEIQTSAYYFRITRDNLTNLGGTFSFLDLASFANKEGVIANFHNWNSSYLGITIMWKEKDEPKDHRFNISPKGSIRQWSPSDRKTALEVSEKLVEILNNCINNSDSCLIVE